MSDTGQILRVQLLLFLLVRYLPLLGAAGRNLCSPLHSSCCSSQQRLRLLPWSMLSASCETTQGLLGSLGPRQGAPALGPSAPRRSPCVWCPCTRSLAHGCSVSFREDRVCHLDLFFFFSGITLWRRKNTDVSIGYLKVETASRLFFVFKR